MRKKTEKHYLGESTNVWEQKPVLTPAVGEGGGQRRADFSVRILPNFVLYLIVKITKRCHILKVTFARLPEIQKANTGMGGGRNPLKLIIGKKGGEALSLQRQKH